MLTRNRARTALAELKQQQQQQQQQQEPQQKVQAAAFAKKPQQGQDREARNPTSAPAKLQAVDAVAVLAKKMNVVSLDSSSEEQDALGESERDAVDLSESSESVVDISSSDDDDSDEGCSSEDEEDESDNSEDEDRGPRKSSSATPASKLLAAEVAKVITGGDTKKLKVDDCRTYLRNYGLRVTGTKPVLIDRIKQHIELKVGGSRSYNRSTFVKDCKGNVCQGDVVLFEQKVSTKFSVTSKSAKQTGSRTVAGRVVKESYGVQRQQHTFTVEVLWSSGCRPLAPMKQLLVKGRNLYKRRTLRQLWADEEERNKILAEKYDRGAAAREVRAIRQGRFKGHAGGRHTAEGLPKKQLANPYTNTLTSKENSNLSSGTVVFQSAVVVRQFAAVAPQQHAVHRQPSRVFTGANTIPLGRIRQFAERSENGEISSTSGCGASTEIQSTGAHTVPLAVMPGVRHSSGASGGAATSSKHREWFNPTLPPYRNAPMQQGVESQHVSSSLKFPGGSSGLQSGPCGSRQSAGGMQAPVSTSRLSQGALSTSRRTGSHDAKSSYSHSRPSASFSSRPASPLPSRSSSLYHNKSNLPSRPPSPYQDVPSSQSHYNRPASPFGNRPSSPYHGRPSSPCNNRPSSPFCSSSPYNNRPSSPFSNRPSSPYNNRPSSPYHGRPSSPCNNRPSSPFSNRPSSPYNNRPSSPYHGRPSSLCNNRPSSPFCSSTPYNNRPSSPLSNRPSSPYNSRPSSPFCSSSPYNNRPSSSFSNRPASPCQSTHAASVLSRQLNSFNSSRRSPSPSVWEGVLGPSPSSPSPSRPASPSPKISSSVVDGGPLGSAPSSPLKSKLAPPSILSLPPPPKLSVGRQFSQVLEHWRMVDASSSSEWKPKQSGPSVSQAEGSKTGFPCPTQSCTYRGSKQCSSGVCYHCCKKKGGPCRNPRHRPEFH